MFTVKAKFEDGTERAKEFADKGEAESFCETVWNTGQVSHVAVTGADGRVVCEFES